MKGFDLSPFGAPGLHGSSATRPEPHKLRLSTPWKGSTMSYSQKRRHHDSTRSQTARERSIQRRLQRRLKAEGAIR